MPKRQKEKKNVTPCTSEVYTLMCIIIDLLFCVNSNHKPSERQTMFREQAEIWIFLLLMLLGKAERKNDVVLVDQKLLLISTLNGSLIAVDKRTGDQLWSLEEDPVLDVPLDATYGLKFFPNPSDGSIYCLGSDGDQLERLPLSIPELVHASPTQSSDGLLYTARKLDMWLAIDPRTGNKLHSITNNGVLSATCPSSEYPGQVIHIARTAYTVTVFDKESNSQKWNATFLDYLSNSFDGLSPSDLLHFCSSSDGTVLSLDRLTGQTVWQNSFGSPVVAIYSIEGGALRKIPMTTIALGTMGRLTGSSVLAIRTDTYSIKATDSVLQPSLFIGFHGKQIYALSSLIDEEEVKSEFQLTSQSRVIPLIDGPVDTSEKHSDDRDTDFSSDSDVQVVDTGHYCLPGDSDVNFLPLSKQIELEFLALVTGRKVNNKLGNEIIKKDGKDHTEIITELGSESTPYPAGNVSDKYWFESIFVPLLTLLFSTCFATCIAVIVTRTANIKQGIVSTDLKQSLLTDSHASIPHTSTDSLSLSNSGSVHHDTMAITTVKENGDIVVGKITYFPQDVLGHGSEGTIVFRGEFDTRPVAVKRILPECFQLADREVELLRQSDQHPNVIRYFCMEQDVSFRYIALELCQATLNEYVEDKRFDKSQTDPISILFHSIRGLTYLHAMGIVHRDIKPRNVLLSFPGLNGEIRSMISDFGLCRRLSLGKVSVTAMSRLPGTEGWIAPEVLNDSIKITYAVDIFSMGCVIYYVLTSGHHPFGTSLRRQANIESGDYSLNDLNGMNKFCASELVKEMISHNYMFRPTSLEVLSHCLFWSKEKELSFYQDVSDRIEKESSTSAIVQALEQGGLNVVKGDWRSHISEELRDDLRRFRSYHGTSVRELLRAMRNKKHHYRELPEEVKRSLGRIPDDFVDYFKRRFPLLLIHTYKQMQICKHEHVFIQYYTADYR